MANRQGKPETGDGYSRWANELLEALYQSNFIGVREKVLFYVGRMTYGFKRKSVSINVARAAKIMGLTRPQVARALAELTRGKVLKRTKLGTHSHASYGINKYYRQWIASEIKQKSVPNQVRKRTYLGTVDQVVPLDYKEKSKENTQQLLRERAENEFETFWKKWPGEKRDKKKCKARYVNRRTKKKDLPPIEDIITALERQIKERKTLADNGEFVPRWKYPYTWINGDCWEDECLINEDGKTKEDIEREKERAEIEKRIAAKYGGVVPQKTNQRAV